MSFKVIFIPMGATLKGKNTLPIPKRMGSIFIPLIVAPSRCGALDLGAYSTIQILNMCVYLLLNVLPILKLYFKVSYFGDFCLYANNAK